MRMSDRVTENERGYMRVELGATTPGVAMVSALMNLLRPVSDNPRLAITADNTKRCRIHPVYVDL